MIPNLRLYLELAAAVLLLVAFGWYTVHERGVGQANLQHSIDAATVRAQADAERQTRVLQAKADVAAQEAMHAQDQLAAYMDAHPLGTVRVCVAGGGVSASVPDPAPRTSGSAAASPAARVLPSVPASASGPDISRGLSALVRAAGAMGVNYREFQQREGVSP